MQYIELKNAIDGYIAKNAAEIFSETSKVEMSKMVLSIIGAKGDLELEFTREVLNCYILLNEKLKDEKSKRYTSLDSKLSKLKMELEELKTVPEVESKIEEITKLVIDNSIVIHDVFDSNRTYRYGMTVETFERWELESRSNELGRKAYDLLVELEHRNIKLSKYTIEKDSIYKLICRFLSYGITLNKGRMTYQKSLPPYLYDNFRDFVVLPTGYELNKLWNSCAREGFWLMEEAICEGKSAICFSRGYNIFINALQKKDVRTKKKK